MHPLFRFSKFLVVCSLSATALRAQESLGVDSSQSNAIREAHLDQQEIVSRRTNAVGANRVLTRQELSQVSTLSELLQREPGVLVRTSGGLGGFSTVSMRGSTAEQVDIRLDGMPLGGAAGSQVDIGPLALDGLERVEVIQAGQAGSDGLPRVELVSRRGGARNGAALRVGSFGEKAGSAWANLWDGRLSSAAWWEASDNNWPFQWDNGTEYNTSDDRIRHLTNNDFTGWGVSSRLQSSEATNVFVRWDGSERGLSSPLLADPNGRWKRQAVNVGGQRRVESIWGNDVDVHWKRAWADWRDPSNSTGYKADRASEEVSDDVRAAWSLDSRLSGWFAPRASAVVRREEASRSSIGAHEVSVTPNGLRWSADMGLAVNLRVIPQTDLDVAWWGQRARDTRDFENILSGLRDSTVQTVDRTGQRWQARLSWRGEQWVAWTSGHVRERMPDFGEWMGATGGSLSNLSLQSERSQGLDFGSTWCHRYGDVSGSIWMIQYENPIQVTILGNSPLMVHVNDPGFMVAGVDLRFSARVSRWKISSTATLQDSRIEDPNPAINGNQPRRTPHWKSANLASVDVGWGNSLTWSLDAQGPSWATELNSSDDARAGRVIYGLQWQFQRGGWTLQMNGRNLSNIQTEDLEDLPLSGRQFQLRVQWELPRLALFSQTPKSKSKESPE